MRYDTTPYDRGEFSGPNFDYMKALSERLSLPNKKWPCVMRPILKGNDREVIRAVYELANRKTERIQTGSPLSSLFELSLDGVIQNDKTLWNETTVVLAVVDHASGLCRLAVMPYDIPERLLALLVRSGLPHYLMVDNLLPINQAKSILEVARGRPVNAMWKRSSKSQNALSQHMREAFAILPAEHRREAPRAEDNHSDASHRVLANVLETNCWTVLDEVGLARLLVFPSCRSRAVNRFVVSSSIDMVLAVFNPDDDIWPLLAIEFDGPHHDRPEQKWKDKLKDALLADAGIPLLRVSYREANMNPWQRASSDERHAMSLYLNPIKRIVWNLVGDASAARKFQRERVSAESALSNICDQLARTIYGKEFHNLSFLDQEMLKANNDTIFEAEIALKLAFRSRDIYMDEALERATIAGALRYAKVDSIRINEFTALQTDDGRWYARAEREVDGKSSSIITPPVSVNFPLMSDERLAQVMRSYLIDEVVSIASLTQ